MSYADATDQVLAVLDDFKIAAFENDEQYEALANAIRHAIAMHIRPTIAAKDAEITRLREALSAICAPNPDCSGDADAWHEHWRNLACARAEIARDTLARATLSQELGR